MADRVDEDGWLIWDMTEAGTWPSMWPPVRYRPDGETRMAICAELPAKAGNLHGKVHGAFLASMAEHVIGVFLRARDVPSVTVSLSIDYPMAASLDRPLTGAVDLMQETGRLQFVRISLDQGGSVILHGIATMRKFNG